MKEAWRYIQSKAGGTGHLQGHHWGGKLPCMANPFSSFSPPLQVNPLISSEQSHGEGPRSLVAMAKGHLTLVRDLSPSAVTTAPVVALT